MLLFFFVFLASSPLVPLALQLKDEQCVLVGPVHTLLRVYQILLVGGFVVVLYTAPILQQNEHFFFSSGAAGLCSSNMT